MIREEALANRIVIGDRTSEALVSGVIFLLLDAAGEELFAALDAGLMEDSKMAEPRVI